MITLSRAHINGPQKRGEQAELTIRYTLNTTSYHPFVPPALNVMAAYQATISPPVTFMNAVALYVICQTYQVMFDANDFYEHDVDDENRTEKLESAKWLRGIAGNKDPDRLHYVYLIFAKATSATSSFIRETINIKAYFATTREAGPSDETIEQKQRWFGNDTYVGVTQKL